MIDPQISIIVPVYKVEQYLDRCVQSISSQTFQDFELILVDDGSPDRCPEMCDEWAKKNSRIRVIHKKNGGAGAARNAALKIAKGNYIGFVDSDDWIAPDMYQILHQLLKSHPQAQIAMCEMIEAKSMKISPKNVPEQIEVFDQVKMMEYFFRVHGGKSNCSICNKLIKKEILADFLFVEGTISEDVEANYFFYTHAQKMIATNKQLYFYFINPKSVTHTAVSKKDLEYINVWKRIRTECEPCFAKYAEMNWLRAHFTILCKMKLYGYNKADKEMKVLHAELKQTVHNGFWKLMKWNMPFSRKALLIIVCVI